MCIYVCKFMRGILIPSVELILFSNLFASNLSFFVNIYHKSYTNLGLSVPGKNTELTFGHFPLPFDQVFQILLRKDCSLLP